VPQLIIEPAVFFITFTLGIFDCCSFFSQTLFSPSLRFIAPKTHNWFFSASYASCLVCRFHQTKLSYLSSFFTAFIFFFFMQKPVCLQNTPTPHRFALLLRAALYDFYSPPSQGLSFLAKDSSGAQFIVNNLVELSIALLSPF